MTDVTQTFAKIFRGRTDAWGTLEGECRHERVTVDRYSWHLQGKTSLGIYPLFDSGNCYWIAADLDQPLGQATWHNGPDDVLPAQSLVAALSYYGANQGIYLEKTKSKGWRVWLFFSSPVIAKDARRLFRSALSKAELPLSIELFPKQDIPIDVGNYIHLPYFGGGPSGPRQGRVFMDLKNLAPIPLEQMLACHQTLDSNAMSLIMDNLPKEQPQRAGHKATEIVEMLIRPLNAGERRPTLIKVAGFLRRRAIPEDVAVALLLPWAERNFAEGLSPQEIEKHIRGIYRRYGEVQPDRVRTVELVKVNE